MGQRVAAPALVADTTFTVYDSKSRVLRMGSSSIGLVCPWIYAVWGITVTGSATTVAQIHFRRHFMAPLARRINPSSGLGVTAETIQGAINRLGSVLRFQQPAGANSVRSRAAPIIAEVDRQIRIAETVSDIVWMASLVAAEIDGIIPSADICPGNTAWIMSRWSVHVDFTVPMITIGIGIFVKGQVVR
jgi:hypothetical protein